MFNHVADCVDAYRFGLRLQEIGRVISVGDGIAWVRGLPSAVTEEIVRFVDDSRGMVFDLHRDAVGVILLDPQAQVTSGSPVVRANDRLDIPVGDGALGRVIDPLGNPLDGLPPFEAHERGALEASSPPLTARQFVNVPLHTGIKVLDTLIPIGRGQRQLVIGDAGTGKTALALDTVIAQRGEDVRCVIVLIGQKRSEAVRAIELLRTHGALAYSTVVVAEATATPGMKYLAPFAGCALAESWMRAGHDTLVVYDDLSTHARAYRELSLLMQRPPGREAYPGDIFYLHARLLERATRLANSHGGGSMTALPVAETEEGEIAAFIPTNLISITDGQIYLDRRLFAAGTLPPVDVTLSVSRIGGAAQHPAIRRESTSMKLEYLQFLELEVYSRFGSRLDPATEARIARGRRLREALKQDRLCPRDARFDLAWLIAFNDGLFDALSPTAMGAALEALDRWLAHEALGLDTPRDTWRVRLADYMRVVSAPSDGAAK